MRMGRYLFGMHKNISKLKIEDSCGAASKYFSFRFRALTVCTMSLFMQNDSGPEHVGSSAKYLYMGYT